MTLMMKTSISKNNVSELNKDFIAKTGPSFLRSLFKVKNKNLDHNL